MAQSLRRFTLRGMLWAMFWAASTCGAWAIVLRGSDLDYAVPLAVGLRVFLLVGPCITVGALYGKALLGAGIGLVVIGAAAIIVLLFSYYP